MRDLARTGDGVWVARKHELQHGWKTVAAVCKLDSSGVIHVVRLLMDDPIMEGKSLGVISILENRTSVLECNLALTVLISYLPEHFVLLRVRSATLHLPVL